MTALESAKAFFTSAVEKGKQSVSNVDLHDYVANTTGQSRDTIHGTLDGMGVLSEADWYITGWHRETLDNGRTIHCRNKVSIDPISQRESRFDYPRKRLATKNTMMHLPAHGQPHLLAIGVGTEAAIERNPTTQIETHDSLKAVVQTATFQSQQYDLVVADLKGYVSKTLCQCLSDINRIRNVKTLAITLQYQSKLRNIGPFQDSLRAKYAGSDDQQAECLVDCLDAYEMVDRFYYRKDDYSQRREVFIFERGAA